MKFSYCLKSTLVSFLLTMSFSFNAYAFDSRSLFSSGFILPTPQNTISFALTSSPSAPLGIPALSKDSFSPSIYLMHNEIAALSPQKHEFVSEWYKTPHHPDAIIAEKVWGVDAASDSHKSFSNNCLSFSLKEAIHSDFMLSLPEALASAVNLPEKLTENQASIYKGSHCCNCCCNRNSVDTGEESGESTAGDHAKHNCHHKCNQAQDRAQDQGSGCHNNGCCHQNSGNTCQQAQSCCDCCCCGDDGAAGGAYGSGGGGGGSGSGLGLGGGGGGGGGSGDPLLGVGGGGGGGGGGDGGGGNNPPLPPVHVPEPSTYLILGGMLALICLVKRHSLKNLKN